MNVAIVMPQLGLTMEEGTVSAWLKSPGDTVTKNEPLFSVSTDKVEMEVESAVDGTLSEIIVSVGGTVRVGAVLAYVENAAQDVAFVGSKHPLAAIVESAPLHEQAHDPQQAAAPGGDALESRPRFQGSASPRAKRLARELGVNVARVRGTGPDQHVTENDVRRAAEPGLLDAQRAASRRQLIAERLTRSVRTIPAFSVAAEVNAEKLLDLYENLKRSLAGASGSKLTVTDLLLMAFARALKLSPEINATWEDDSVRTRDSIEIALAIATANGVLAPVLRNLDAIDLSTLVARRALLVERARSNQLLLADLEGGVTTLSNLGMYRVDHFQAIISPGQTSILAVGQIRQRPWVENVLTVKPTLVLNLTVDHRVTDGAAAAAFLGRIAELLENPENLSLSSSAPPDNGARISNV